MQDIDRVDNVQSLALPARSSCVRMQAQPLGRVERSQKLHRRIRRLLRWGNVRQNPPVRSPELKLAAGQSLALVSLFMNGAVVTPAQEREVRQR